MAATRAALLSAALLASAAAAHAAPDPSQDPASRMDENVREAVRLVVEGDRAAGASNPGAAWELYARAWAIDPASAAPARGICRLATAYGQHQAAAQSCQRALALGLTPEDMRNRVASWVVGPTFPPMEDLVSASFMADGAVRLAPREPWGYRARADVALRLGDADLLAASLADLQRVAPDHEQTRRLRALVAGGTPVWIWLGRVFLILAPLLTAAHALIGRPIRRRWAVAGTIAAIVVTLFTTPLSHAASVAAPFVNPPTRPIVDEANPESTVQAVAKNADPMALADLLFEIPDLADKATKRGDHAAAARYWKAIIAATPERTYGYARLCDSLDALGQRDEAIAACRTALTRQGTTVRDYDHFAKLLLEKRQALSPTERRQIDVAIAQLATEPQAAVNTDRLRCSLAAHEHDVPGLRACSARLVAAAPDDLQTIWSEWALALEIGDVQTAQRYVDRVRANGRNGKAATEMQTGIDALRQSTAVPSRAARALRWAAIAGLAFALAIGLFALATRVSRALQRRAAPTSPEEARP